MHQRQKKRQMDEEAKIAEVYKLKLSKVKQMVDNEHQEAVTKIQIKFKQQLAQQRQKHKASEDQYAETQKAIEEEEQKSK